MTASPTIDVSVTVCTHRRAALLAACLESLETQANPYGAVEILVIDNCADGSAEPVVRNAQAAFARRGIPLRHVVEPRPGVAHARNRSLEEARHPIIAYIDDDERATPGWLARLLAPFAELGPAVDIVAGEVEPDFAGTPRPDWLTDELVPLLSCRWGWGGQPRYLKPHEWFGEGNCAFRRALLAGRGFNTALGRREGSLMSNEGIAFTRARQDGAAAYCVPQAVVFHHVHPERLEKKWLLRRMFFQGLSDVVANREIGRTATIQPLNINLQAVARLDIGAMPHEDFRSLLTVYYASGYAHGVNMY